MKIKIPVNIEGHDVLLLIDEKYKSLFVEDWQVPAGTPIAYGRDKESGKPLIYIHSKFLEKMKYVKIVKEL